MGATGSILAHFDEVKARWMDRVLELLEQVVDESTPKGSSLNSMASYHMSTGGKRLRALIPLLVAETLGESPEKLLGFAAACEMLHNATLVHDDLQDGDTIRRGQPTVWTQWGMPRAVNLGDAMLYWTFAALEHVQFDDAVKYRLSQRIVRDTLCVIDGQEREFLLQEDPDATLTDYFRMVEGKTSGLFALPIAGAAQLCGAPEALVEGLAEAARHLGVLFQLQDDLLDIYGDKGRDQVGTDLGEGKISALVAHFLSTAPADEADWLRGVLAAPREELTPEQVERAAQLFRERGTLAATLTEIERRRELACNQREVSGHEGLAPVIAGLADLFMEPIAGIAHA